MATSIQAASVSKKFGQLTALEHLDLDIGQGEIFGLIGPDGAGKTTTIRILAALLAASSGEVKVAGFSAKKDQEKIRAKIGYVSQTFSLYGDLSIEENLDFFADIYEMPAEQRQKNLADIYGFSRLEPFKERRAGQLSGGMQKKLALGCALIHSPEILFLDEPTTGVDPVSRQDLWDILFRMRGRMTIFVSTPYLDEAERCDRIALLHKGRVLALDTPDKIKQMIKKELLEIECPVGASVFQIKNSIAHLRDGQIFGNRIHLLTDQAETVIPAIREEIAKAALPCAEIKRIAPSLEDAFISLIGSE